MRGCSNTNTDSVRTLPELRSNILVKWLDPFTVVVGRPFEMYSWLLQIQPSTGPPLKLGGLPTTSSAQSSFHPSPK